ncbi:hypothetical protein D3C85_1319350 [compost metagenome]
MYFAKFSSQEPQHEPKAERHPGQGRAGQTGNADRVAVRGTEKDPSAQRQRPVQQLAHPVRGRHPAGLLRPALAAMERAPGGAVRPGQPQVLPVRSHHLAAGLRLPRRTADVLRLCAVRLDHHRRPAVVRLLLSADRLHRDHDLDRAAGGRRPQQAPQAGQGGDGTAQAAPACHQPGPDDRVLAADRLYPGRLLHADARSGRRAAEL